MSQREERESQGKRLHSKADREPSPKRPRRDGKPATERTPSSNHSLEMVELAEKGQKHRRRLQDALPLEASVEPESKMVPDVNTVSDKKTDGIFDSIKHSDPTEVPRSRSYFQHDERGSAGQGGQSFVRKTTERRRWNDDPKDRSRNREGDKMVTNNIQKREDRIQTRADDSSFWHHDGFFELQAEALPSRKRTFREKKMPQESRNAADPTATESGKATHSDRPTYGSIRREERRGHHPHGSDERNAKPIDRPPHRGGIQRVGGPQRETFGDSGNFRVRDKFNGRYGERNQYRQGGLQAEKWKHDLFDEANRSPTPKNEEDQIAKVEALLAS